MTTPGTRIDLDGALNLRDLGGWQADGGVVASGRLFRSDRLAGLSDGDLALFDGLGVRTVIDLRHENEVADAPNRLWSSVTEHHHVPMMGDTVRPTSFLEMVFNGEMDGITDTDVGEMYIGMLTRHATGFGQAINTAVTQAPSLFHCTAGKDRTGLFAMLVLGSLGVSGDDILTDFTLSNVYRSETRIKELAPTFAERGLDVEDFRPALSAPQAAMEMAMEWLAHTHGTQADYLTSVAAMTDDELSSLRTALIA